MELNTFYGNPILNQQFNIMNNNQYLKTAYPQMKDQKNIKKSNSQANIFSMNNKLINNNLNFELFPKQEDISGPAMLGGNYGLKKQRTIIVENPNNNQINISNKNLSILMTTLPPIANINNNNNFININNLPNNTINNIQKNTNNNPAKYIHTLQSNDNILLQKQNFNNFVNNNDINKNNQNQIKNFNNININNSNKQQFNLLNSKSTNDLMKYAEISVAFNNNNNSYHHSKTQEIENKVVTNLSQSDVYSNKQIYNYDPSIKDTKEYLELVESTIVGSSQYYNKVKNVYQNYKK